MHSTIDKAAWLMTYRYLRFHQIKGLIGERKLRDTSLGKVIFIDKGIQLGEPNFLCEYQRVTSRYGWVLLRKNELHYCQIYRFLLYSPFTDEVIELQTLDVGYSVHCKHLIATFYLNSKNSECLVFGFHVREGTIGISTCRPGDEYWKMYEFLESNPIYMDRYPLGATYLGGCFYCLFATGALGVFYISRQEWELLVEGWPDIDVCTYGELVAVPRFPCLPYKRRRVMKFDILAKRWVEEDLNFKEMVHPDLRFLSNSEPLGESSSIDHHLYAYLFSEMDHPYHTYIMDHHLYAYLYSEMDRPYHVWTRKSQGYYDPRSNVILIEPPLKCIWRRHHLLSNS
ncbi:hypothetical protein F3Y22_tig00110044pilonHSYRG00316 [Hibiscus syriacus]|uniref:KIB1-4 beta-propeller domain-containing protein n=1 Tax=Hibiscus syriacus TaxID=106335 RepID=A0A6A3BNK1_HIBSY|nr:hypothetical protein F3Y22_tig00110044pilonHSYRG00316 [Hibiscus syriacus]